MPVAMALICMSPALALLVRRLAITNAGTMEGGRQADVAKSILTAKNVPYVVAAPLLIQVGDLLCCPTTDQHCLVHCIEGKSSLPFSAGHAM